MSDSVNDPGYDSLGTGDFQRPQSQSGVAEAVDSSHLALLYESADEQLGAVLPFVKYGLDDEHRCLYMADEHSPTEIRAALADVGVDVATAEERDQLVITSVDETYLSDGFDPQRMLQYLIDAADASLAEGFAGLHVTGEMSWTVDSDVDFDRIMAYEARFDQITPDNPIVALCQYNIERFDPDAIIDVIHTHPRIIYQGRICDNPYYTPPEEFLGSDKPELEMQRLLETTYDLAEARDAIRRREQRLEVVNRVLRHNIRNDLNVVLGHSDILRDALDDTQLQASADQIHQTAMDLFEIAKEAKHVEASLRGETVSQEPQYLNAVLKEAVDEFTANQTGVTVDLQLNGDVWVEATEDFKFALTTLLTTLQDYTETLSITVEEAGSHSYIAADVRVQLCDGVVPDHEVEALMQGTETPLQHSKGIGLWLVNWVIEQSDGDITFETNRNSKNTIVMSLPTCAAPNESTKPD